MLQIHCISTTVSSLLLLVSTNISLIAFSSFPRSFKYRQNDTYELGNSSTLLFGRRQHWRQRIIWAATAAEAGGAGGEEETVKAYPFDDVVVVGEGDVVVVGEGDVEMATTASMRKSSSVSVGPPPAAAGVAASAMPAVSARSLVPPPKPPSRRGEF